MNPDPSEIATLFADIAGSTGLYQRHGDSLALAAVEGCLNAMKAVTNTHGGTVVKTVGDELMASFDSADSALWAACEMQWRAAELPPLGTDRIALRIGFQFGPALLQGGDVYGDSVNTAARLAGLAKAGQIVTSGATVRSLSAPLAAHTRKLTRLRLRGSASEEDVFTVLWDDGEDVTKLITGTLPQVRVPCRVVLCYGDSRLVVGQERQSATFGRDATNDVVVNSRLASRVHARVEWRGDRLVLVDQSTNGTHVVGDDGIEALLRLEEMILRGSGRVGFGAPVSRQDDDVLVFSCEAGGEPAADISLGARSARLRQAALPTT